MDLEQRMKHVFVYTLVAVATGCSGTYAGSSLPTSEQDASGPVDAGPAKPADAAPPPLPALEAGADAETDAGPPRPKLRVFVTTNGFRGNSLSPGNTDAVTTADRFCANAAAVFQLTGTFKSWLNTSKSLARDRIVDIGPWYDVARTTVVFPRNPSAAQPPTTPIPQPDGKAPPPDWLAWTGSDPSGNLRATCGDWTNATSPGRFGRPSSPAQWVDENEAPCEEIAAHLYCFEVSAR